MKIKANNPKVTQKRKATDLGCSDSTRKRYSAYKIMDRPYNREKTRDKTPRIPSVYSKKSPVSAIKGGGNKIDNSYLDKSIYIEYKKIDG